LHAAGGISQHLALLCSHGIFVAHVPSLFSRPAPAGVLLDEGRFLLYHQVKSASTMSKRDFHLEDTSSDEEEKHKSRKINRTAASPNGTTSTAALGKGAGKTIEGNKSNGRSTDSLWAELQQVQQNEMSTVQRQRAELEQEKSAMNTLAPEKSDIVAIDLGGEVIIKVTAIHCVSRRRVHASPRCLAVGGKATSSRMRRVAFFWTTIPS
jgi:hypothetical protein